MSINSSFSSSTMSGTKTLQRCRNMKEADNVVLIDVDSEHFDSVIIIDVPEPLPKKWRGSSMVEEKWPFRSVICIDDDESSDNDQHDDHHQNVSTESKNGQHKEPPVCFSTGKTSPGNESPSPFITEEDAPFDSTSYGYRKSDGHKRSHSGTKDPPCNYSEKKKNQHCEPVSLSCQNEENLNPPASSYSPYHGLGAEQVDHPTMAFQDDEETQMNSLHGKPSLVEEEASMCKHQNSYETDSDDVGSSLTDKEKKHQEETFTGNIKEKEHLKPYEPCATSSVNKENLIDNAAQLKQDNSSVAAVENLVDSVSKSMDEDEDDQKHIQNGGTAYSVENCIITEREKLKETDEYKRALEQELASRRQALKIEAEEAQRLRQLRRRKKEESIRLQDMANRQKKRVEEVRETQKKDVENLNLKEVIRSQVRKELKKLEMTCCNMASLLHSLGIPVGGWPCPSSNEVQAAYKRALLKFHPDRAPQCDIRQQVEAEEKFKLINRLKEKLLPS
ncbi:uncharacterized protein LOC111403310 [Olea europaea var. sylvestris]|uniref:uncharacterized protein LOC111403310 n=1 Tax=Olea europaea var. sylvestris TaxID=158386 RepID=UPI000C1D3D5F|nr:uncharacterized protein LOC111403310 [Olea europaea var. sylvestris]XP_022887528.1 uncharacterized protein LOC111403310 [Olea europaea var. sylvestris]